MAAVAKAGSEAEPTPGQPADRKRLAVSIAAHGRARDRLVWLQNGARQLEQRSYEAHAAINTAAAIVEETKKSGAPPAYLKLLIPTAPEEEDRAAAAQRRLEKAQADWEALRQAREVLAKDVAAAQDDARRARDAVTQAIGGVAQDSDPVRQLCAETRDALARFVSLLSVWQLLSDQHALPVAQRGNWDAYQGIRNTASALLRARLPAPDGAVAARWREAFTKLAEDAGAELPE